MTDTFDAAQWQLLIDDQDASPVTGFDFDLTVGRRNAETQPGAHEARFTLYTDDRASWVQAGAPVALDVVVDATAVRVATLMAGDVTRRYKPRGAPARWVTSLTAIGTLAKLGRSDAGGPPNIYPQEGDRTRITRYLTEAGLALDHQRDPTALILNDVDGSGFTPAGSGPKTLTQALPATATGHLDCMVDVTTDAPAKIMMHVCGRTVATIEAPTAGTWRLHGYTIADPTAARQITIVAVGRPTDPGPRWSEVDPALTWDTYPPGVPWNSVGAALTLSAANARIWRAGQTAGDAVQITARESQTGNALQLCQQVAEAARGTVWETRHGTVSYESPLTRNSAQSPVISLPAAVLPAATEFNQSLSDVVNHVTVTFGYADSTGARPSVVAVDQASINSSIGRITAALDRPLADQVSAQATADHMIARRAWPVDRLTSLQTVDSSRLPETVGRDLIELPLGSLLEVVGAAPDWNGGTAWQGHLEGWALKGRKGRLVDFTLVVSPRLDSLPVRAALAAPYEDPDPLVAFELASGQPTRPTTPAVQLSPSPDVNAGLWKAPDGVLHAWTGRDWLPLVLTPGGP